MTDWLFSVGNVVSRAPGSPVAVSPAVEDTDLTLDRLGTGYPDQQAALQWRPDGSYAVDAPANLLAVSGTRSDALTGWRYLPLVLTSGGGLPADVAEWVTYSGRTALLIYGPWAQWVEVEPGEDVLACVGLILPSGSAATGARLRVVDASTGRGWEGASTDDWAADGIVATQDATDAWLDVSAQIVAEPTRTERTAYLVIVEPVATSYGPTTYVYVSGIAARPTTGPELLPAIDLAAVIGHDLPIDATVTVTPDGGTAITLTPAQPSCYAVAPAEQFASTWRVAISMGSAYASAPRLGELWLGIARPLVVISPVMPISVEESHHQINLEAARGRREVVADEGRPPVTIPLQFACRTDAALRQIRDEITRLTRGGATPMLLMPGPTFDGSGRVYHGRVGDKLLYSVEVRTAGGESLRKCALAFAESPMAP